MNDRDEGKQTPPRTPEPERGSAEPVGEEEPAGLRGLDHEIVEEMGQLPRADALDPGDPGAPAESLGTEGTDGPGPGARHEGGAGGSGARVAALRQHGEDIAEDRGEAPAGGGPGAGRPT